MSARHIGIANLRAGAAQPASANGTNRNARRFTSLPSPRERRRRSSPTRALTSVVAVASTSSTTASASSEPQGTCRSMLQWNDWRLTTKMRIRLISHPSARPTTSPMPLTDQSFGRQHGGDLPPRDADVPQHAELAPPREHQRAERRRQADQAERDRGRLQRIGHRERAVEDAQRHGTDVAGRRERRARRPRQRAPRVRAARRRRGASGIEDQRGIVRRGVAGQLRIQRAVDDDRALLPRIVAPHAGDGEWRHRARRAAA